MSTEERKLAAIVFTDICGFTYESMGDVEKAKKSYNALLDLWKNADKTNPELIDTKNRLKNLNRAL